jgi:predicted deacylase
MRFMGMLPVNKSHPLVKHTGTISRASRWERAPSGGLFIPLVALGKAVKTGDTLGIIAPPQGGGNGTPVKSTIDGIVIGRNNEGLADEGDALFHVAAFSDAGSTETMIQKSNDSLPEIEEDEDEHPVRYHPFAD